VKAIEYGIPEYTSDANLGCQRLRLRVLCPGTEVVSKVRPRFCRQRYRGRISFVMEWIASTLPLDVSSMADIVGREGSRYAR
jgi:hypothetical protein